MDKITLNMNNNQGKTRLDDSKTFTIKPYGAPPPEAGFPWWLLALLAGGAAVTVYATSKK